MSNGITTASGEVVVRGEAEERGSLGVCVMLEYKWEREEDGDSRWGKKGHLENVESEAHVDSKICTEWFQFKAIYLTEKEKKNQTFCGITMAMGVLFKNKSLPVQQIKYEINYNKWSNSIWQLRGWE